ncbi:MAG: 5-formyltetrahydrofolate cyclo-ligase [Erysipelotrichales bacterium]|nr:MAG: 5-formyltetrahydrofolate cyclo-ligase [Erysipelotrichales bacterium]
MNNQTLRTRLAQARYRLPMQRRIEASAKISDNILWLASDAHRIGTYLSFASEVDTIDAIMAWLGDGKEVYVPRMTGDDFQWIRLKDFKTLATNSFGIPEPIEGESIDIAQLDVVFVPMFGFDDELHRIGHGKGCFDRGIKNYAGRKIGLCYAEGYVDSIFPSSTDVAMDIIITEKEIYSKHR